MHVPNGYLLFCDKILPKGDTSFLSFFFFFSFWQKSPFSPKKIDQISPFCCFSFLEKECCQLRWNLSGDAHHYGYITKLKKKNWLYLLKFIWWNLDMEIINPLGIILGFFTMVSKMLEHKVWLAALSIFPRIFPTFHIVVQWMDYTLARIPIDFWPFVIEKCKKCLHIHPKNMSPFSHTWNLRAYIESIYFSSHHLVCILPIAPSISLFVIFKFINCEAILHLKFKYQFPPCILLLFVDSCCCQLALDISSKDSMTLNSSIMMGAIAVGVQ